MLSNIRSPSRLLIKSRFFLKMETSNLSWPCLRRTARPTSHNIWILSLKHSLLLSKWVQLIYKKKEKKRKARSLLHMSSMCAYMWTICVGHAGWWHPSRPQSSDGPAEVFSGFTRSVPPKHFFLSELNCVPREGERANHVSRGHFQSGDGLYLGPCGGRSRKRPATKNNKSSKSARVLLHVSWGANVTAMYDQGNIALHWCFSMLKLPKCYIHMLCYIVVWLLSQSCL